MLHDWLFDRHTREDAAVLAEMVDGAGAVVMGRRSFDECEGDGGWGDKGPAGDTPCFVVTHNPPAKPASPVACSIALTTPAVTKVNTKPQHARGPPGAASAPTVAAPGGGISRG